MDPDETVSPGGGLAASIIDYWRFTQMMLNGGELDGVRILQPATVDLMTQDHLRDGQGPLFWYQPGRFSSDDPGLNSTAMVMDFKSVFACLTATTQPPDHRGNSCGADWPTPLTLPMSKSKS